DAAASRSINSLLRQDRHNICTTVRGWALSLALADRVRELPTMCLQRCKLLPINTICCENVGRFACCSLQGQEAKRPILLWLLGVPLSVIVLLLIFHVI